MIGDRRRAPAAAGLLVALTASAAASEGPRHGFDAATIDRAHLPLGRSTYRIVDGGREAGTIVVEGSLEADRFVLRDLSTMPPTIEEEVVLRLDAATLRPQSAWLTGRFGEVLVRGHFRFDAGQIDGYVRQRPAPGLAWRGRVVAQAAPPGAQLRGALIYLVPAIRLVDDGPLRVPWLSALDGRITEVTLAREGEAEVDVPAGHFHTERIGQRGGSPENVFYVQPGEPRRTVRIDVVDRPMTIELVAHEDVSGRS